MSVRVDILDPADWDLVEVEVEVEVEVLREGDPDLARHATRVPAPHRRAGLLRAGGRLAWDLPPGGARGVRGSRRPDPGSYKWH